MAILGPLVGITTALGYAAFDEIRSTVRISSYHVAQNGFVEDQKLYSDLCELFDDNWENNGASLFPQKLVPFLAQDTAMREEWIDAIVISIMAEQQRSPKKYGPKQYDVRSRAHQSSDIKPFGTQNGSYCGVIQDGKRIVAPAHYEYQFVAAQHPDDWEKYVEYKEASTNVAHKTKVNWQLITDVVLLLLGVLCCASLYPLFSYVPGIPSTVFVPLFVLSIIPFCVVLVRNNVLPLAETIVGICVSVMLGLIGSCCCS